MYLFSLDRAECPLASAAWYQTHATAAKVSLTVKLNNMGLITCAAPQAAIDSITRSLALEWGEVSTFVVLYGITASALAVWHPHKRDRPWPYC
jgi:hypothetical protein